MTQNYCIIKSTCKSKSEAVKISKNLLKNKLIACSNIIPIQSFYCWENKIVNHQEFLLLLKTKSDFYPKVRELIISNHSYKTPEIIMIKINDGFNKYFDWIENSLKK